MDVLLKGGTLRGTVEAIASKSHVHRLLICAALAKQETVIKNIIPSKDILTTADCLEEYLAQVKRYGDDLSIRPYPRPKAKPLLNCTESGSTYRFLVPVACAKGVPVAFTGSRRLAERPLSPLYELLCEHGCTLSEQGVFPLHVKGKLQPGNFLIDGGISSQFISGLLLALPLLTRDSTIQITGELQSYPYIKMTLDALKTFSVDVKEEGRIFYIKGNQHFISPGNIHAEGDWSNAAFFAVMGAFSPEGITIQGLRQNSLQGDKAVLDILATCGATVTWREDMVAVKRNVLRGQKIDAAQIPDLVPILAVMACAAEGQTVIYNAQRLRLKESDRIETVFRMIRSLGGNIAVTQDGFIIQGTGVLQGGTVDGANDHRIVMAAAAASCICREPVRIHGAEAVEKSYPYFFEDMKKLGAFLEKI